MKFKLGCASAVLMFLCFDTACAGALKNSFSKDQSTVKDKNENESKESKSGNERPNIDDNETSTDAVTSTPSADVQKNKQEATQDTSKKEIKGNPVIYRIGNKEIRRDEILAEMKLLPPQLVSQTPADKLFDIMKRQKLMTYLVVEQAKRAGLDKEKEYIDQINKLKERVLFESYLIKELEPKASNATALNQKYQTYLVEFKSGKEIKISTIALSTEKEAKEVISALGKGASFDKLQKEKGLASSENSDRYIPVLRMPEELKKKFNTVAKNEVTKEPIKIADTYHVIKIVDMRDSKPGKFEEVKPLLSQVILREEMDKLLTKLENQYKVQKFNEDGTPEVVAPKVPKINLSKPPAAPAA